MVSHYLGVLLNFIICANTWLLAKTNGMKEVTFKVLEHPKTNEPIGNLFEAVGFSERIRTVRLEAVEKDWLNWFRIDRQTGIIFTKTSALQELDREKVCHNTRSNIYGGKPTPCTIGLLAFLNDRVLVKINLIIEDKNDNPPVFNGVGDSSVQSFTVDETSNSLSTQLRLQGAYDADLNDGSMLAYYLDPPSDKFALRHTRTPAGELELYLQLLSNLDYERKPDHWLNLTACDNFTDLNPSTSRNIHCTTQLIHITVRNENDERPTFRRHNYSACIEESTPLGKAILAVEAIDSDLPPYDEIFYEIVPDPTITLTPFTINVTTGIITVARNITVSGVYRFLVKASNKDGYQNGKLVAINNHLYTEMGKLSDFANVTVNVIDVNDNKPEIVLQLSTETKQFELFQSDVLSAAPLEDAYSKDVFLMVQENIPTPINLAYFLVTDRDANVNAELSCILVTYGNKTLSFYPELLDIFGLQFVSKLADGKYIYSFFLKSSLDAEQAALNSGPPLRLTTRICNFLSIRLNCTDFGSPPLSGLISIHVGVVDVDEFAPNVVAFIPPNKQLIRTVKDEHELFCFNISLKENLPNGTIVMTLRTEDKDAVSLSHYERFDESLGLEVDENSGEIFTTLMYDYETVKMDVIKIKICERNFPVRKNCAFARVEVHVQDVNDNPPQFTAPPLFQTPVKPPPSYKSQCNFDGVRVIEVEEEQKPDAVLFRLIASDADENNSGGLVYFLVEVGLSTSIFHPVEVELLQSNPTSNSPQFVVSKEGIVWSKSVLDRETDPTIDILVAVHDLEQPQHTSCTSVRIKLTDKNDHAPTWQFPTEKDFLVLVQKSTARVGDTITRVHAFDPDDQLHNGKLSYELLSPKNGLNGSKYEVQLSYSIADYFIHIDKDDGVVRVKSPLDNLPNGFLDVWLQVMDHGSRPLKSTSKMVLYFTDASTDLIKGSVLIAGRAPVDEILTKLRTLRRSSLQLLASNGNHWNNSTDKTKSLFIGNSLSVVITVFIVLFLLLSVTVFFLRFKGKCSRRRKVGRNIQELKIREIMQKSLKKRMDKAEFKETVAQTGALNVHLMSETKYLFEQTKRFEEYQAMTKDGISVETWPLSNKLVTHDSKTLQNVEGSFPAYNTCSQGLLNEQQPNEQNYTGAMESMPTSSLIGISTDPIPLTIVTYSPARFPVPTSMSFMDTYQSSYLEFPQAFNASCPIPTRTQTPDFIPSKFLDMNDIKLHSPTCKLYCSAQVTDYDNN